MSAQDISQGPTGAIFIAGGVSGRFPSIQDEGPVVTDAPYAGEVVNVFTQTLSDGNRIRREDRVSFYRDRQGRTRREETVNGHQTIRIHDHIAGVHYILDPEQRTGQMLPVPAGRPWGTPSPRIANQVGMRVQIPAARVRAAINAEPAVDPTETTEEDLGTRVIEGVTVVGTRSTSVLPAEAFYAERDIEITFERWYSEELQLDVERIRKDPRSGESHYQLTNINRSEPLPSLFEPPADYQVEDVTHRQEFLGN